MLSAVKNKITQASSFIDEAFEVKRTLDFRLILQIGVDGLLVAVNEGSKNKYIALENYTFQNAYNFDVVGELLDEIIKDNQLLKHTYGSVTCLVANNLSTLVPNPLFDEDKKNMYLKFNTSIKGDEVIAVDDLKNLDAKNVFAIPGNLKEKLDKLFANISYHHFSSPLIDGLLSQNKNKASKKIFVHVQSSHFEVLVMEGKNLLFYNTFNHHSAEDFIYYLLFVCEQLQLNPENIEVSLLGEIEKNSAIYAIAQKYIRNLKFGERADDADYSYQLQTLPKHFYFTLFNNYLV